MFFNHNHSHYSCWINCFFPLFGSYFNTGDINLLCHRALNPIPPKKLCLHTCLACFSLATCESCLILFPFFHLEHMLDCVGPCQRPSITPWCPAELEIHSTALNSQNEKTRAWVKNKRAERRGKNGEWIEWEVNQQTDQNRSIKSKTRAKLEDE